MRGRTLLLLMAVGAAAGIAACDRADKGSGDSNAVGPPSDSRSSDARISNDIMQGGTGNAPTSAGTGATNGVVGNETRHWVGGPGNIESSAGTTTQPASH